jgi:peptidoglycan/xylan/chitin deacetylase (PgdA/CDA1 family)
MGLDNATRRLRNTLLSVVGKPSGILIYHRVADLQFDPQLLTVGSQHFAEQLQVLRQGYHPMTLQDWVANLKRGTLPRNAVAVTFDDGYADNLINAKQVLESYDVPATVFITAGYIGRKEEFWWDQLAHVLLEPGDLPERMDLRIGETTVRLRFSDVAHYTEQHYLLHRSWNVTCSDDPTPRHRAYRSLCKLLKVMQPETRDQTLERMLCCVGHSRQARPTHRTLSESELKDLPKGELIEVGAHTVTHPMLSTLPVNAQQMEIRSSKKMLEDMTGRRIRSFAYPYGTVDSYTADTVTSVRDAGFEQACSNGGGGVWRLSDRYQLPRQVVRNWNGSHFACWLKSWLRVES